jgi:hypothetical protein
MSKVFLSHSSKDKANYVRLVAEKLGQGNIEYDEFTFEEGEETAIEIDRRLDSCDLFALFISDNALNSKWVIKEITRASKQLSAHKIRKIYPIIIDSKISHDDSRIPKWLQDQYNLKFISRPVVAARRIESKLRELHWDNHPTSKDRSEIFVGRNETLNDFENRLDDIDLPKPVCIIASGLRKIGRSMLLQHALTKSNIVSSTYKPIKITLDRIDSIEDLIIKIFDTGLTSKCESDISGLLGKAMSEKETILKEILQDIANSKEIIFIEDAGCLVTHDREVAPWLLNITSDFEISYRPVVCISAMYRTNPTALRKHKRIYALEVPELNPRERSGLLKRLLELNDLFLSPPDFSFFSEQLHGFPQEAYYCTDLIIDHGVEGAKKESHQLTEFNTERASLLLRRYESNKKALDFIYFLSEFEFASTKFIFEIVDENEYYSTLEDLVTHLICDYVGGEHEYIRLNDTIRDLIKRNRLTLPEFFKDKLRRHVHSFIKDSNKFERDAADYFYSIKEALTRDEKIDDRYLVPSHILRTIKELYQKRENLKRVVKFADMLLDKEASLDPKVSQDVRYYLCLSLARQKDKRVLKEATKIHGPEHDFVLGYYYRLCGRHADAIERLKKLIHTPYIASRAKRELVQVYLYIEEYDKALAMAKENYEGNRGNQFPIQSYLNCLLNSENPVSNKDEIERLISELDQIKSSQSMEMTFIAKSLFEAKINANFTRACNLIDDAIALNDGSPYPLLSKFDIALRFNEHSIMLETLNQLESIAESRTFSKNTIIKNRAYYQAAIGNSANADRIICTELSNYPEDTIKKIRAKIVGIAGKQNGE